MTINQPVLIDIIWPRIDNKTMAIARNVVLILSFAVITALCSQLKLEIGLVPITMQTFAVLLSGILLGSKKGASSQMTYLLGGLAGIPWLSHGGGMAYILSPTFGYIIGFVIAAFVVGKLAEQGWAQKIRTAVLAMLVGSIVIYFFGCLWLARFVGLEQVLAIGLYPFIIGDLLKISLAGLTLPWCWKIISKIKR